MSYTEHHISSVVGEAIRRKLLSHEVPTEEVAWTAARCNRLLRTITQRTTALRKILDNFTDSDINLSKKTTFKERRPGDHWSTTDPVWLPDGKRKGRCRTYTARTKVGKEETQVKPSSIACSGVAFPSPFIRRIGSIESADQRSPRPIEVPRERQPPARLSRQLPIKPRSPAQEAEQGLVAAFGGLLATTSSREPPRWTGAPSLLTICLRKVPSYIELNAEFESGEHFTSEIFEYLEQYGLREHRGWAGLRIVVRGHAIHLIRTAIVEGLISADTIEKMINLCGIQDAILEGQELLQTWLETSTALTSIHTTKLGSFGVYHRCQESMFRTMRLIGSRDHAKLATLCRRPGFWNELLRSLAGTSGQEAAGLLAQCTKLAVNHDAAVSSITSGVKELILKLTTMAASALLLARKDDFMYRTILQIAADAAFSIWEQNDCAAILADGHSLIPLIFDCALLLSGLAPESAVSSTTMTTEAFGRFAASVQASSQPRRDDFAESIVGGIVELEKHLRLCLSDLLVERVLEIPASPRLFQRVALAALTAKRQSIGFVKDEEQYQDVLKRLTSTNEPCLKTPRTPFRKNANAGYRWEDGICEWVAATPFTAAASTSESCDDNSVASFATDTPATETSFRASPDKENQDPIKETHAAAQKIMLKPLPRALPEQSPDVLAMTPQVKRPAESPSIPAQKRARLSRTSSTTSLKNGRRGRKASGSLQYSDVEQSADELGF